MAIKQSGFVFGFLGCFVNFCFIFISILLAIVKRIENWKAALLGGDSQFQCPWYLDMLHQKMPCVVDENENNLTTK
jgi:hypothetical protein